MVGAVASFVDWGIFSAAHFGLGLHYVAAAALSLVVATLLNYVLSVRYVFASGRFRRSLEVILVYSVSTVGVGLNIGLMIAFVEGVGVAPLPAKMGATCMVFFWNYLARKHLIFARVPRVPSAPADVSRILPASARVELVPVRVRQD